MEDFLHAALYRQIALTGGLGSQDSTSVFVDRKLLLVKKETSLKLLRHIRIDQRLGIKASTSLALVFSMKVTYLIKQPSSLAAHQAAVQGADISVS